MLKEYVTKNKIAQIPNMAFTHGGQFHADDVFSAALLKYLNPEIEIRRGFENQIPENYEGIVFDIGFTSGYPEFDHHGEQEYRENGVPYASFGKLWRKFGELVFQSPEQVEEFDKSFVQTIDHTDCTGILNPLSVAISSYMPVWDSEKTMDEAFEEALSCASVLLSNKIEYFKSLERAKSILEPAYAEAKNGILILPKFTPWQSFVKDKPEINFVIFPSRNNSFGIQGVQAAPPDQKIKVSFPKEWLGQTMDYLSQQVEGLTFCHANNFFASTLTLESALKTIDVIYSKNKELNNVDKEQPDIDDDTML